MDAIRPGRSKTLDIEIRYDTKKLPRRHLVAWAKVRTKKGNKPQEGWKFTWLVKKKVVGSTQRVSVKNVEVTKLGFVLLKVVARKGKKMLQKSILLLIKKRKLFLRQQVL